jgi:MFS transporter, DHA2 family, multidrug resistance protein
VLLGLGAAAIIPLSPSVLTVLFSPQERPRAVGVWAAANFLALPLGPILGGGLLTNYWWGWAFLINLPVVLVGLLAAVMLLPESRSATRTELDPLGVLTSSAGLAVLVYGVIRAGQHGWGDPVALTAMVAGALVLVGFGLWERRLGQRQGGQPLVDLSLFHSTSFTWGTILAAVGVFALFGVLFTAPQYFQAILGTDAMGSGLRLLPLIGGLAVAASMADRIAARAGVKATTALGFALLAVGLGAGAGTSMSSGAGYVAVWTPVVGLGMGFALATASAAAILGSVLNTSYRGQLDGLPAHVADAARDSVLAGVAAAQQPGSVSLLHAVRAAFVDGMDAMLWGCAAIAAAGMVLALVLLPGRAAAGMPAGPAGLEDEAVARG